MFSLVYARDRIGKREVLLLLAAFQAENAQYDIEMRATTIVVFF